MKRILFALALIASLTLTGCMTDRHQNCDRHALDRPTTTLTVVPAPTPVVPAPVPAPRPAPVVYTSSLPTSGEWTLDGWNVGAIRIIKGKELPVNIWFEAYDASEQRIRCEQQVDKATAENLCNLFRNGCPLWLEFTTKDAKFLRRGDDNMTIWTTDFEFAKMEKVDPRGEDPKGAQPIQRTPAGVGQAPAATPPGKTPAGIAAPVKNP
ncbi:MAG: hypothetical protein NUV97_01150 [archaeon]|nr:hypothetical protein [archaeon]MCR4323431.1 hypothetical protein [Nanoarchaeota archaeon]